MEFEIVFLRLITTFVLALMFGIERQKSHKPVGFGTFIFVALGSCALSIIALEFENQNPLILISAIVTGIGFLGAGALIKTTDKIFGFTTAASIWLFAIMGLAIGTGYYNIGISIYFFVWVCIYIDRSLENGKIVSYQRKINLELNDLRKEKETNQIFGEFKLKKYKLLHKKVNKTRKKIFLGYLVECSGKDLRNLIEKLEKTKWVVEINLE